MVVKTTGDIGVEILDWQSSVDESPPSDEGSRRTRRNSERKKVEDASPILPGGTKGSKSEVKRRKYG